MIRRQRWTRTFSAWEAEEHGAMRAVRTLVPDELVALEVQGGHPDDQLERLEIHGPIFAGAILEWRCLERNGKTHVAAAILGTSTVLVEASVTSMVPADARPSD